ncbi:MAG: low temperature requirement protein A [Actinomycetota bacterium]|nr:low temperature requirement protein A [Actinomycetota bacterium]
MIPDRLERHPSWLELFFDLVFVAAVAAMTQQLQLDHSVNGLGVFAGLFVPVWWAWRGFAWYATGFGTEDGAFRVALLAGMLGVATLAAGIDGAAHGDSTQFVIAYAGLLVILAALHGNLWWRMPEVRQLAWRHGLGYGLGASLWLASLALGQNARPWVWAAAMLGLIAVPIMVLRQPHRAYDAGHIAERYGLFTLIVLGESVVVTVSGMNTKGNFAAAVVAVFGFVLAVTIWWVYFARYRAMPAQTPAALFVWAQMHFLVFAGIVATAVGVTLAVESAAIGRALTVLDRLPLGAGLAAYLLAMATIRAVTRRLDWEVCLRLTVGGAILGLALLGAGLSPVVYIGIVGLLLAGGATVEMTGAAPAKTGVPG